MTEQKFDFGCRAWHTSGVSHDNDFPWAGVPAPAHALSGGIISQLALGVKYILTFARPEVYEALEARAVKYAIRIPANDSLERDIAELLPRPVGRPSQKPLVEYKGFLYQAASWKTARRVVARVEHHAGELFPRMGFIVTNLTLPSRAVVRCYNKRGTSEQWIKEGKQAVKMTRLSCHRFRSNEVRLWLSVIAYNLGNLWRRLVLPQRDRQVVAHQLAAAAGADGRPIDQTRPVLLAALGGEPSDKAVVHGDGAAD